MTRLITNVCACLFASLLSISYSYAYQQTTDPTTVFPSVANPILQKPDSAWGVISKPYPTAAWFSNFTIKGTNDKEAGLQPVYPTPYTIKNTTSGLSISLPQVSYTCEKGDYPCQGNKIFAQVYAFVAQMELATTSETALKRSISEASELSVTVKYAEDDAHYMSAPIVRGSPYVTMFYHDMTPMLIPGSGVQSVNDQPPGTPLTGSRFAIQLAFPENKTQTWILYSEKPITLVWRESMYGWRLTTDAPYSGWLRVALLEDTRQAVKNDASLLDQYSTAIPMSGNVTYDYSDNAATIKFNWKTENNLPPLMMALPHQQQILETPTTDKIKMRGNKGELLGVIGSTWMMKEPLPATNFLEITNTSVLREDQKKAITDALEQDVVGIEASLDPSVYGVYTSGKRFARAARLALLADLFGKREIKKQFIDAIEKNLTTWIQGKNHFQLQYDTTWGGVIPSIDDFGSQTYNDHHFHYGYYVYTMAVLAKLDAAWLQQPIQSPTGKTVTPLAWIQLLIRDFANTHHDDNYFPYARHMDSFNGHSYASGLGVAFADGRNQESVSEAVNAYYAIALLGQALHDETQTQWGQFLLAQELRAAHTYWQIQRDSKVFTPEFIKDNHITAIVWDGKVDSHTWFGANPEFVYGIEMMPFTAITTQLLAPKWSREAYKTITDIYNKVPPETMPWKSILLKSRILGASPVAYLAIWNEALNSGVHDEGDSKTNSLFYISAFMSTKKN